jgi:hypothetical protein
MKSAAQIVGILILIGSMGTWSKFFKQHPNFDLLGDASTSGKFMGMLFMSAFALGLIVYGFQKGTKKKEP